MHKDRCNLGLNVGLTLSSQHLAQGLGPQNRPREKVGFYTHLSHWLAMLSWCRQSTGQSTL